MTMGIQLKPIPSLICVEKSSNSSAAVLTLLAKYHLIDHSKGLMI